MYTYTQVLMYITIIQMPRLILSPEAKPKWKMEPPKKIWTFKNVFGIEFLELLQIFLACLAVSAWFQWCFFLVSLAPLHIADRLSLIYFSLSLLLSLMPFFPWTGLFSRNRVFHGNPDLTAPKSYFSLRENCTSSRDKWREKCREKCSWEKLCIET